MSDGFEFDFRQAEEFDSRQQGSAAGEPDQPLPAMGPGGSEIGPAVAHCEPAPARRKPTKTEGGGRAATTWRPDWCAQMLMGEIVLTGELLPDGTNRSPMAGMFEGGTIDGPLPPGLEVGFAYPVSIHLVRATEHLRINALQRTDGEFPTTAPPHLEACTLHIGRYAIRGDGFEHTMHCSKPQPSSSSVSVGFGESFINRLGLLKEESVKRLTIGTEGFELDFAAYMTPFIQEASLRSFVPSCGIPI